MKAFEKMEKREERRKEALQRISGKREPVVESGDAVDQDKEKVVAPDIGKVKPARPAPRRRRYQSGSTVRKRTQSATASQPASEDDNSNTAMNGFSDSNSLDQAPPSIHIPPPPTEVGSTSVGTIGSLSSSGFRFPRMKKVSDFSRCSFSIGGLLVRIIRNL